MNLLTNIIIIVFIFCIIIGIQSKLYITKDQKMQKKFTQMNQDIQFNIQHSKEIDNFISQELYNRLELLKTMPYNDWIEYNQNNTTINFQKMTYHISIWRKIPEKEDFILKCYQYKKYINNNYIDFWKRMEALSIYHRKYSKDENLLSNFYYAKEKPYTKISHFWVPAELKDQIRKSTISVNYDDGNENTGIICSGYSIENVSQKYYTEYFKMSKTTVYIISVLTFLFSILICFINRSEKYGLFKSIIFIIIVNIYITHFILSGENERTNESETQKENSINSGIMSISFLVGVNIFIISKLERDQKNKNKTKTFLIESSIIFVLVLVTLLLSILKITNYNLVKELSQKRLAKELFFNISVVLNIYIIINFSLYMLGIF